jgi:hypothetical protein
MRKPKLESNALYRPLQPFTVGSEVYNLATRLRGDHPAVTEYPELWIAAEAADDEVAASAPAFVQLDSWIRRPGALASASKRQSVASGPASRNAEDGGPQRLTS